MNLEGGGKFIDRRRVAIMIKKLLQTAHGVALRHDDRIHQEPQIREVERILVMSCHTYDGCIVLFRPEVDPNMAFRPLPPYCFYQ